MEGRKLKRMLDLKRRIEKAKKGELAIARDAVEQAQGELSAAQQEQQARLAQLAAPGEVSLVELTERARFAELAGHVVSAARVVVSDRERALNERQDDVVLATRDVRTFEKLTERDREEQRLLARSAEQRAADDQASARWSSK
jgi:flagellar export protein FliJ